MAQCVITPQEFVQNAFNPVIAVLGTPKVEAICQKNNLSFVELVQPFCKLNAEVHLRDPTNQSYPIKNLRLNLVYMNDEPPKQMEARKMLYDVVSNTSQSSVDRIRTVNNENYSLQINSSTPWFESYRDWYLKVAPLGEHEFVGHFFAFIMVVSADDTSAMLEFARMSQEQHNHQYSNVNGQATKWFFTNPLKYYILIQDVDAHDQDKTETLFQNMKSTYGANSCHLLRINSRNLQETSFCFQDPNSNLPDPWSQFLARRPTIVGLESDESNFTTPSPVEDQDHETGSSIITSTECVDHPLMLHRSQKQSLSSISIELDDELNSSLPVSSLNEGNLANFTLNSESIVANQESAAVTARKCGNVLPHGACLTSDDTDRIRLFIQEFCMRSLLPYIEKQMATLNEQVTNRKGLHRSFFSATKKWFGTNKPGPNVGGKATPASVVYSADSIELQVRHLGDIAFMFQHYELAYQAYHSIKRDFNSDQAWMHYSGALEMAALSVFMLGSSSQRLVPFHYLDTAINIYLNTCKSNAFATRATLLATECLKSYDRYLEAASYFVRLTSEESDLRSALLLEQAAHCHLSLNNNNIRKFAFYIILAGHRFNKAGQKKHALRCYKQALQVYQGKQWMLAEDHINLTTGRLSFTLNHLEDAINSFYKLLYDGSLQGVTQQMYYLREYLVICSHWFQKNDKTWSLPRLPIPVVNAQESVLILGEVGQISDVNENDFETNGENVDNIWCQLEEAAIIEATGSLSIIHRPMLHRYTNFTNNIKHPLAIIGEAVTLLLPIRNPLNISLMVTDVHLTWSFQSTGSDQTIHFGDSEASQVVETKVVPEIAFSGLQGLTIRLSVIPRQTGHLRLLGIAFNLKIQNGVQSSALNLNNSISQEGEIETDSYVTVRGTQPLVVKGNRLNSTKEERCGVIYSQDLRLEPLIQPVMPKLKVSCRNFKKSLYCGEVNSCVFELTNSGNAGVKRIFLAASHPEILTFGSLSSTQVEPLVDVYNYSSNVDVVEHVNGVFQILFPPDIEELEPGGQLWLPFWIQGPQISGNHTINLLIYYESPAIENNRPRYRTLSLSSTLDIAEAFSACAIAITGLQPIGQELKQNVTIAVEASNICSINQPSGEDKTIKVLQISCASQEWIIEPLDSKIDGCEIPAKQSWKWCFRAVLESLQTNKSSAVNFSNISFNSPQVNSSKCPCSSFYRNVIRKCEVKHRDGSNETKPTIIDIPLCLIFIWQCYDSSKEKISYGQHHVLIQTFDAVQFAWHKNSISDKNSVQFLSNVVEPIVPTDKIEKDYCLRYYLFSPGEVHHDFSISRACIVPVFLVVYNDTVFDIETEVDANRLLNNSITPPTKREVGRFAWIGCCRTSFNIKPKETKVVRLQGCFFHHGTYSLNTVGIVAKPSLNIPQSITVKGSSQLQIIWDLSQNYNKPYCL